MELLLRTNEHWNIFWTQSLWMMYLSRQKPRIYDSSSCLTRHWSRAPGNSAKSFCCDFVLYYHAPMGLFMKSVHHPMWHSILAIRRLTRNVNVHCTTFNTTWSMAEVGGSLMLESKAEHLTEKLRRMQYQQRQKIMQWGPKIQQLVCHKSPLGYDQPY